MGAVFRLGKPALLEPVVQGGNGLYQGLTPKLSAGISHRPLGDCCYPRPPEPGINQHGSEGYTQHYGDGSLPQTAVGDGPFHPGQQARLGQLGQFQRYTLARREVTAFPYAIDHAVYVDVRHCLQRRHLYAFQPLRRQHLVHRGALNQTLLERYGIVLVGEFVAIVDAVVAWNNRRCEGKAGANRYNVASAQVGLYVQVGGLGRQGKPEKADFIGVGNVGQLRQQSPVSGVGYAQELESRYLPVTLVHVGDNHRMPLHLHHRHIPGSLIHRQRHRLRSRIGQFLRLQHRAVAHTVKIHNQGIAAIVQDRHICKPEPAVRAGS